MHATNTLTKKNADKWFSIPEEKWMLILALVIFLANIQIYSVQTLVQDDNHAYYFWQKGELPSQYTWKFYPNVLLTWTASKVDFFLARSMLLVGVLIPAALLLFRILIKLEYPLPVALFSSGLFGFSPGQTDIPIFINGSYTADAMLFMLIALWSGLNFLQDGDKRRWGWFISAIAFFYWALRISELVIPSTAALIFCFLFWSHFRKKAWFLSLSFALLALHQIYFHILHNSREVVKEAKPLTSGGFLKVGQDFVDWCLPSLNIPQIAVSQWEIIIIITCSMCLVIALIRGFIPETEPLTIEKRGLGRRGAYIWRVIFPVILCLSTLMLMSVAPWFRPRHALFPAVGLYLFLSFPLYEAFKQYKYGKTFIIIILIWLATGSMLQHYKNNDNAYSYINKIHEDFMRFAITVKYPPQSQIVVVNMNPQTCGFWYWSTGYLQSALNRNDISGLIGDDLMLIDPFIPANFSEGGMNGLVLDKPLFLYRKTDNGFTQLAYFLQWKENSMDSSFTLYQADPITGKITSLTNGRGRVAYLEAAESLSKQGINRSDIMWGGEPSIRDRQRLGLS